MIGDRHGVFDFWCNVCWAHGDRHRQAATHLVITVRLGGKGPNWRDKQLATRDIISMFKPRDHWWESVVVSDARFGDRSSVSVLDPRRHPNLCVVGLAYKCV